MSDETPTPRRKRSPYTGNSGILVQFTDKGDTPLDHTRERKGARSAARRSRRSTSRNRPNSNRPRSDLAPPPPDTRRPRSVAGGFVSA